ncbi:MAG: hypothetical protein JSU91_01875 [Thermoplasmatales archaeon]|nr:MAG: hypothetical protein JSU91_01875 [Thermoplasmatales archaeon]
MGKKTISTPSIIINDILYPIVPNTFKYTEGFGEYNMRGSSIGAGQTEVVFSENAEDKMSKVMFELYPTAENIKSIREWKAALNDNLIEVSSDDLTRTFTNAALVNDYEVETGADTTISLEFVADPAV